MKEAVGFFIRASFQCFVSPSSVGQTTFWLNRFRLELVDQLGTVKQVPQVWRRLTLMQGVEVWVLMKEAGSFLI